MSDEAKKKSLFYVGTKHEQKAYYDGYNQGRADALKGLGNRTPLAIEKAAIEFDKTYFKKGDSEKVCQARRFAFSIGANWAWRWIPVSERLPDKSGIYLTIRFKGDEGSDLFYSAEHKGWNIDFFTGNRKNEIFPTHWMELPPAPITLPEG